MQKPLDTTNRPFLEHLRTLGEGTVQGICESLGITATAVRHRLSRLIDLGFVTREVIRAGRGRPHHIYRVSDLGLRQLGDNYADLAQILWREIRSIEEPELQERLLRRVKDAFVRRYGVTSAEEGLSDRFTRLGMTLVEHGFDVEVDSSAELPVLREKNCPYLELATNDRFICELEQSVFERVLGADVQLTQCCLDGHNCCEFQVVREEDFGKEKTG